MRVGYSISGHPFGSGQNVLQSPTLAEARRILAEMELMPWGDEDDDGEEPGCYELVQIAAPPGPNATAAEPPPDDFNEQEDWNAEEMHVVDCISGFNTPSSRPCTPLSGFCSTISGGGLPRLLPLGCDVN